MVLGDNLLVIYLPGDCAYMFLFFAFSFLLLFSFTD